VRRLERRDLPDGWRCVNDEELQHYRRPCLKTTNIGQGDT
jgi:hypothetical protein